MIFVDIKDVIKGNFKHTTILNPDEAFYQASQCVPLLPTFTHLTPHPVSSRSDGRYISEGDNDPLG